MEKHYQIEGEFYTGSRVISMSFDKILEMWFDTENYNPHEFYLTPAQALESVPEAKISAEAWKFLSLQKISVIEYDGSGKKKEIASFKTNSENELVAL